ncbi:hypothetical protein [Enterocloster bolteae]|nr:hypothetical protein [Enterocloster bolteae]DAH07942.1 MAG TPA: hypothetical protein [Caudoviricetes sp.]DAW88507.1 MAG TPA: hypothetical protein [Caudoviricetes sp.]
MENNKQKSHDEKEKVIWKTRHTPLKDRKSSSGITFWPEKVKVNEQK